MVPGVGPGTGDTDVYASVPPLKALTGARKMGTEQALPSLCGWWQNAGQFGNSQENDPQAYLRKGGGEGGSVSLWVEGCLN